MRDLPKWLGFSPESWWARKLQLQKANHVFLRNHVVPFLYRKSGSRKLIVFTHFSKDPNFEVRRPNPELRGFRAEDALKFFIHLAVKSVDRISADHKILNEQGEPCNTHRYAVIVQDLATEWIQSHQCKIKPSQKTRELCRSSPSQTLVRE